MSRFSLALTVSVLLHLGLLGLKIAPTKVSPASTAIEARLLPAARSATAHDLLKNTLDEAPDEVADKSKPTQPPTRRNMAARQTTPPAESVVIRAQRQLADVLFYPPEAIRQRLQGEVRLLLTLDAQGRITDAQIAAGSGHALLDAAALEAARALGPIDDGETREMILPVVFRLR